MLSLLTKKVGSGYVTLILTWVTLVLLIWADWRVFSRKLDRRMAENRRYLKAKDAVTGWFSLQRDRFTQRRDYVFFRCPGCRAVTRVPRHKGKLRITCRRCGYSFEKRT